MTLALQAAPGEVTATSLALAPCLTDAGKLVMRTDSVAGFGVGLGGGAEVGLELAGVGRGVGVGVEVDSGME